jgi:hypothetical protein
LIKGTQQLFIETKTETWGEIITFSSDNSTYTDKMPTVAQDHQHSMIELFDKT